MAGRMYVAVVVVCKCEHTHTSCELFCNEAAAAVAARELSSLLLLF